MTYNEKRLHLALTNLLLACDGEDGFNPKLEGESHEASEAARSLLEELEERPHQPSEKEILSNFNMGTLEFHRAELQEALFDIPDHTLDNDMWHGVTLKDGDHTSTFDINVWSDPDLDCGSLQVAAYNVIGGWIDTSQWIVLEPIFTRSAG